MPERILNLFNQAFVHDWVPFFMTVSGVPKLNISRIVEALLIAAIVAGVTTWGTSLVLEYKIESIKNEVRDIKDEVREIRRDIYVPRAYEKNTDYSQIFS